MFRRISVLAVMIAALLCSWTVAAEPGDGETVNINTANVEQLQLLPRIGPSLAQRIVDFREANGTFETVDELVAVKGIGEKGFISMKPFVSVEGDTTLAEKVRLPKKSSRTDATS